MRRTTCNPLDSRWTTGNVAISCGIVFVFMLYVAPAASAQSKVYSADAGANLVSRANLDDSDDSDVEGVGAVTNPVSLALDLDNGIAAPAPISQALARPAVLPALYASYAALQVYDVYSTKQALDRDAREANPLMRDIVGNTNSFLAVKAAMTVGTIVAAERLWKTNRIAAIAVMVASNGVAAIVAARNARALHQLR